MVIYFNEILTTGLGQSFRFRVHASLMIPAFGIIVKAIARARAILPYTTNSS